MKSIIFLFMIVSSVSFANVIEKSKALFDKLDLATIDIVHDYYDAKAVFIDPLGTYNGVEEIKKYYASVYSGVESVRFDYPKAFADGNKVALFWKMYLVAPSLGKKVVVVDGVSDIIFDKKGQKIIYQRDYFDASKLFYKNIPILKNILNFIDKRIKAH